MIFMKLAMLAALNGQVTPSMEAGYQPLSWLSLGEKLELDIKKPSSVANVDLHVTGHYKEFSLSLGHKAELQTISEVKTFQFVELSYKKEF